MVGLRILGAALSPILFAHLPILLVIMSPFLVNLIAVSPLVSPQIYFPVALVITTLQSLVGFYFGVIFGTRALHWVLNKLPLSNDLANRFLEIVRKASILAIFAIPGPILGTIAGVAGVRRKTFLLLTAPAQLIWITGAYFIGELLLEQIATIRHFVVEHAILLTSITLTLGLIRLATGVYKGRKSS